MKTFHASPERSSPELLQKQLREISSNIYLEKILNSLPFVVMILNSNRQIVCSNESMIQSLKISDFRELLGKRPGEALNCIHSRAMEEGCGTSINCRVCGAVNAIVTSMSENRKVVNECRIITEIDGIEEFNDFEVTATPIQIEGSTYTIFSLSDISSIKRKNMLERIFFHDILNTAGNLKSISELLVQRKESPNKEELLNLLYKLSNELVEEIRDQRILTEAESGGLSLDFTPVNTNELLQSIINQFNNQKNNPIQLKLAPESENFNFLTDKAILKRILKNMVKNSLEAVKPEGLVTIKSQIIPPVVRFTVHNPGMIPKEIQLQIFKRNFSTKDVNRGLGTYSMKLLGERFLKGKVSFVSNETLGTEFYFDHPYNVPGNP